LTKGRKNVEIIDPSEKKLTQEIKNKNVSQESQSQDNYQENQQRFEFESDPIGIKSTGVNSDLMDKNQFDPMDLDINKQQLDLDRMEDISE